MEAFLLYVCALLLCFVGRSCSSGAPDVLHSRPGVTASSVRLDPTYEEIPAGAGRNATYALWQTPPSPHAVLFVAHGGHTGPEIWWDATPACAFCIGLPEEKAIIQAALAAGHAVITIKSVDSQWSSRDTVVVREFVESWSRRRGFPENLPVAGLGISMGGFVLSNWALQMKLYAIVLQISTGLTRSFEAATATYPPVLFIPMSRDLEWGRSIQKHIGILSSKGLGTEVFECPPHPVYDSYFSERIPGLGVEVSVALYNALVEKGYLDDQGYINQPPFMDWQVYDNWDWSAFLKRLDVLPDGSRWIDPVSEELAVSYGFHAVTSSKSSQMLDWLDRAKREQWALS